MIEAVGTWSAQSAAGKAAWNTWALANPPGDGRHQYIAAQAFQKYGDYSSPAGWPILVDYTTAPDFNGHPSMTLVNTTYIIPASTGVSFNVRNTSPHTVACLIEISTGLSNGRNYWKGPWDAPQSQGAAILTGVTKKFDFGGLVTGMRYYVRARTVTTGVTALHQGRVISAALITYGTAVTNP